VITVPRVNDKVRQLFSALSDVFLYKTTSQNNDDIRTLTAFSGRTPSVDLAAKQAPLPQNVA